MFSASNTTLAFIINTVLMFSIGHHFNMCEKERGMWVPKVTLGLVSQGYLWSNMLWSCE